MTNEVRNIAVPFSKAREWYNSNNAELRELALLTFNKEELEQSLFKNICRFKDACKVLNIDPKNLKQLEEGFYENNIFNTVPESLAILKINIIRRALNIEHTIEYDKGDIYYPYLILSKHSNLDKILLAELVINNTSYNLYGGVNRFVSDGVTDMSISTSYCNPYALFVCATKEIAEHMLKHFYTYMFEALYLGYVNIKWSVFNV